MGFFLILEVIKYRVTSLQIGYHIVIKNSRAYLT